jgi:hypothetical protein
MAASPPKSHETWAGEAWTREFRFIRLLVFGNGTGFVWLRCEAQEKHVLERALVIEMEAGLVAVDEG